MAGGYACEIKTLHRKNNNNKKLTKDYGHASSS